MADITTPVVDSYTPGQSVSLAPGAFVDVTIVFHDPDSKTGTVTAPLTDLAGNVTNAVVTVTIDDPVTAGTAVVVGVGVTAAKIASTGTSATYRIQA